MCRKCTRVCSLIAGLGARLLTNASMQLWRPQRRPRRLLQILLATHTDTQTHTPARALSIWEHIFEAFVWPVLHASVATARNCAAAAAAPTCG